MTWIIESTPILPDFPVVAGSEDDAWNVANAWANGVELAFGVTVTITAVLLKETATNCIEEAA